MSRAFWSRICFLLFAFIIFCNISKAETIGGATCIYAGSTYQYSIQSINSTRNYSWCATGGTIVGVSGCKSAVGYSAYVIEVVWDPGSITRVLTLNWSGGSPSASGSHQLFPNIASTFLPGAITSATSQTINYNTAPGTITCSAASGGECSTTSYSYQWQASSDNVNWADVSGATSQNYTPSALTNTTYFRRVAISSAINLSASSNVASIFVNPQLIPGSITSPVSSPISFNSSPGQITGAVPTGGGCSGAYNYQWESSLDNNTFTAISGATAQDYTPTALSVTTYFRRKVSCGTENKFSNVISVGVAPQLLGGNISQSTINIAYNASPGQLNCTVASGGNCSASYTYQWESSPDNITYSSISGATSQNYTPGLLTSTISYRRKTTCGIESTYSSVVTVVVMQPLTVGTISPLVITVNYNSAPGQLNGTVSSGGNCGGYTYQWESSLDNISFVPIVGETSQNLTPGNLTANVFYRRKTTCGTENGYTNTIAVTVNQPFGAGTLVPFSQIIASGSSPALLTANPASGGSCGGAYSYQWQQSTNGTTFSDISGATGLTYQAGSLTTTTYYRRRTTCGAGNYAYTNISSITVGSVNTTAVNFIKVRDITKPGVVDATSASALTDAYEVKQTTQFFDGIGRLYQTVNRRETPLQKDMVVQTAYDDIGREAVNYLPYVSSGNTGEFRANSIAEQFSFNNTAFGAEQYYYSLNQFEASPLNRVGISTAPGASWAGANRGPAFGYFFNTDADEVRIWNVSIASQGSLSSYTSPGVYPAGRLYKNITTDEHGKQVVEFKDKEGRIVLKKVQLVANADDGTGSGHANWLCTYYIYDKLGNLRCVVQPRGVELITGTWLLNNATILADQCFRYEYDARKRMIIKKVPGAAAVYMIYDVQDRLVMTQDGNLRSPTAKWLVTKYDHLNRPTETGIWTDALSFATHLANAAASTSSPYPNISTDYEKLSVTHYDDYINIPGGLTNAFDATWASHFESSYNVNPVFAQQQTASKQTRGMVTWAQTLVLGTSDFLNVLSIYDDRGRSIQVKSSNSTGGSDIATTQYNWNGQPIRTSQSHEIIGSSSQTNVAITKYSYDHSGRLKEVDKKVQHTNVEGGSMPTSYTRIVTNEYTEFGQLKKKNLGNKPNADPGIPLAKSDYLYNIRGWLVSVNKDYINASSNSDQYFGFELGYDKSASFGTFLSQYNGNIGGMLWKSEGDQQRRKYDFTYDAINRLTAANFTQYVSGSGMTALFNTSEGVDFSVSNLTYDANGNILTMTQNGLKLNASSAIDNLRYTYIPNTNRLRNVKDFNNDATTKLGDFKTNTTHSQNAAKSALTLTSSQASFDAIIDYTYDVNGNLTVDKNKGISSITYNYLNLPSVITVTGKGTITYTYDAVGNKLKKTTAETGATVAFGGTNYTGVSITTSTTYLGGLVFESKNYPNNTTLNTEMGYTDRLQFLAHEEGRIRYKEANSSLQYDYMLKDHLGNVRMVLTEEQQTDFYPAAALEGTYADANTAIGYEKDFYTINTANVVDKSTVSGISDYPNNNGIASPYPAGNSGNTNINDNSTKLYKLQATTGGGVNGLGMTLKVMSGDKIDVMGNSYYPTANSGGSNYNVPVLDIITGLLGATGGIAAGKGFSSSVLNGQPSITNPIGNFLGDVGRGSGTVPKAYVNWILFDENFKYVNGNFSRVGSPGSVKSHYGDASMQNIQVNKNGYLYVYVSNESPVAVFFDNLQVVHTRGRILEEAHYYPFGLTMVGISSNALAFGQPKNMNKYNGKEEERQEFSDGSGLEFLDYGARMYDNQLGRWHGVDELAEKFIDTSPYAYVLNNPVIFKDLDGRDVVIFSKDGKKLATFSKSGMTLEKGVDINNTPEIAAYRTARAYLSKGGSKALSIIENSNLITEIYVGKVASNGSRNSYKYGLYRHRKYDDQNNNGVKDHDELITSVTRMNRDNGRINWDPTHGMIDNQFNFHSPALLLDHEAWHAALAALNLAAYLNSKYENRVSTNMSDLAEQFAITLTNITSKILNNGDGGKGTRIDHAHTDYYKASGVTDFTGLFYNPSLIQSVNEKKRKRKKREMRIPVFY